MNSPSEGPIRRDFMNPTTGKASRNGLIQLDVGLRRRFLGVLRAGMLALSISVCVLFRFPGLTSDAQATDCSGNSIPPDKAPQYFPTGAFGVRETVEAPLDSCFLRAMHEIPLMSQTTGTAKATYRLLVVPPWRPPFIVRLEIQTDGTGILVKKEARSQIEAGVLTVDTSQAVSKEQVEVFDSLVTKADLWSMPTILVWPSNPRMPVITLDGIVGVLEGAKPGAYHVVQRYLPYKREPAGAFETIAVFLFKDLAQFEIPPPPVPGPKHKRR